MSLLEMGGDRAGALQAFESYRARLASDFAAEPAPETVAIATRLRSATPLATPPPIRRASPTPAPAPSAGSVSPAAKPTVFTVSTVAVTALAIGAAILWTALSPATHVNRNLGAAHRRRGIARRRGDLFQWTTSRLREGQPSPAPDLRSKDRRRAAVAVDGRLERDRARAAFGAGQRSSSFSLAKQRLTSPHRWVARRAWSLTGRRATARFRSSASWSPKGDSIAIVRNDSLIALPVAGVGWRAVGVGRGAPIALVRLVARRHVDRLRGRELGRVTTWAAIRERGAERDRPLPLGRRQSGRADWKRIPEQESRVVTRRKVSLVGVQSRWCAG